MSRPISLIMVPTHVVIDSRDGHVFSRDHHGRLFTGASAAEFMRVRNEALTNPTYLVMILTRKES
jgi:hypothetical protein